MDVVTLIQGDAESPLSPVFLVHAISGSALPYLQLQSLSDNDRPVYGISSPVHCANGGGFELPGSLRELAALYLQHVCLVQPQGPYILGGWSMGGMVAICMAQMLHEHGEPVQRVIMIDSANPEALPSMESGVMHGNMASKIFERAVAMRGLQFDGDFHSGSRPVSLYENEVNDTKDDMARFDWQTDLGLPSTATSSPCASVRLGHASPSICSEPSLAPDTISDDSDDESCSSSLDGPEEQIHDYLSNIKRHIYHGLRLVASVEPGHLFPPGSRSEFEVVLISCAPSGEDELLRGGVVGSKEAMGWDAARFSSLTRLDFSGGHDSAFEGENIAEMSDILKRCLADLD